MGTWQRDDTRHITQDAEHSIVVTWLLKSMTAEISCNYKCYLTVEELQDNVKKITHIWVISPGSMNDAESLVKKKTASPSGESRQGEGMSPSTIFVKRFWKYLDLCNIYEGKSTDD